jgi:hypothetical protein
MRADKSLKKIFIKNVTNLEKTDCLRIFKKPHLPMMLMFNKPNRRIERGEINIPLRFAA